MNEGEGISRTRFHVCLSGDLGCSGIAPCTPCWEYVRRSTLPAAMFAGGFNGSVEQSTAFYEGYSVGWRKLEAALNHDMALRPLLRITDVGAIQDGMAQYEAAHGEGQPPPPNPGFDPPFEHVAAEPPPTNGSALISAIEVRTVEKPPSAVEVRRVVEDRRDESERSRIAQLAQPMDAEEIAAAAAPAVLGSVMGSNFVPAAERARRAGVDEAPDENVGS